MKKNALALALSLCLVLMLFTGTAYGANGEIPYENKDVTINAWGIPADDVIWFGVYKDEPVDWLVLDAGQNNIGGEGVFLLSRGLLDKNQVAYDEAWSVWEGSDGQQWCTDFAQSAFTAQENRLIPFTDKEEGEIYLYALGWRPVALQQEQVFFLSVIELEHYFGSYGKEDKITVKSSSLDSYYWLRSPVVFHYDYHGIVLQGNMVHDYLPQHHWSARPCMNLNLQEALWVMPAEDEGGTGPVERPEGEAGGQWKLLIPGEEDGFRAETTAATEDQLTVAYAGAAAEEGAMLSLLIQDKEGRPLALWRLEEPKSPEGELKLDLKELAVPEEGQISLFQEYIAGPRETNTAGALQRLEIRLPVPEEPEPSPEATEAPEDVPEPETAEAPVESAPAPGLGVILPGALVVALLIGAVVVFARRMKRG